MIRVAWLSGVWAPRVFCDHCGQPIDDVRDGNAEWKEDTRIVYYTHKHCCAHFEELHGGRAQWLTDELADHLGYLCHNTRFDKLAWDSDPLARMRRFL